MKNSLYLGKILGIEIRIHYSWFIIFLLITITLADSFSRSYQWSFLISLLIGIITALFLFISILFHEVAHSYIGTKNQTPIKSISLFVFGGVAEMTKEPPDPFSEFKMAIAGPLTSLILGLIFLLFSKLPLGIYLSVIFSNLFLINILLIIFNLVPAYPLDGGRVFRSILWSIFRNFKKATYWASRTSRVLAFLIIFAGFLRMITQDFVGGLWFILIGLFLFEAAEASFQQVQIKEALSKIKIARIMNREIKTVGPKKGLDKLQEDFLHYQQGGFPVVEKEKILGIITIEDMKKVEKENWAKTRVSNVMTPAAQLVTVSPADSAFNAFMKMSKHNVGRLPVVSEGRLLGLVTRSSLLFVLSIIEEGESES